jgi:hypothetical protein
MELALLVYGISVMSGFAIMCVASCFSILIFIVCILMEYSYNKDIIKMRLTRSTLEYDGSAEDTAKWKATKSLINKHIIIFMILAIISVMIPSKQTAYVMVAAYAAQSVAQQAGASVLSEKVLKVIEKELDNQLAQIKK